MGLPDYIENVESSIGIKDSIVLDSFTASIQDLAKQCNINNYLSTTIYHESDASAMLAILHMLKDQDNSVSISYAIHTLTAEWEHKSEPPNSATQSFQSEMREMRSYQEEQVVMVMESMGVTIHINSGHDENPDILQIEGSDSNEKKHMPTSEKLSNHANLL